MASAPTYYDYFGVSPTASTEQIRAAYLLLMKKHHPDLGDQSDPQRSADFAAFLNRSYAVLRDPRTRARYNAYVARQSGQSAKRQAYQRRRLLTADSYRPKKRRWDVSSFAAAALACAVAATVIAAVSVQGPIIPLFPASNHQIVLSGRAIDPRSRAVREEARLAMSATAGEAELASRRCFRSARDQLSLPETELCVIFDDAYVDWTDASNGLARPPYFEANTARLRHEDAVAALGASANSRLSRLNHIAVSALLSEIQSRIEVSANTGPQGEDPKDEEPIGPLLSH